MRFRHSFDTPGSHVIEVATDADSPRLTISFGPASLFEPVPVLVINGAPDPEPPRVKRIFCRLHCSPTAKVGSRIW